MEFEYVKNILNKKSKKLVYLSKYSKNPDSIKHINKQVKELEKAIALIDNEITEDNDFKWKEFDYEKIETGPDKYGKYLIARKDGKIHWETWNGSGWAYNHKEIRYWAIIKSPFK